MSAIGLIFSQNLKESKSLLEGRLALVDLQSSQVLNLYSAASGLPQYQTVEALAVRGKGSIPPSNMIIPKKYSVSTRAIALLSVKGVEGNFYQISPDAVNILDYERGDFGVHRDANVPGTAGCIGITTESGWVGFERDMERLSKNGCTSLPLIVFYLKNVN